LSSPLIHGYKEANITVIPANDKLPNNNAKNDRLLGRILFSQQHARVGGYRAHISGTVPMLRKNWQ